jgi:Uma2 family endonuclease
MQPAENESKGVVVRHRVAEFSPDWVLYEGRVPEAPWHDLAAEHIRRVLQSYVDRERPSAAVYRNCAVRMLRERPSVGFDPDVCFVDPAPAKGHRIDSLKTWLADHHVPLLSIEVVSKSHPTKDYVQVPDQCAAAGIRELVIFDPARAGPRSARYLLQVWQRAEDGGFERVHAGDGPARSSLFDAWWIVDSERHLLRLSDDASGTRPWPTDEDIERQRAEDERQRAEDERQRAEDERQRADAAAARVAELEAELARRR